MKKRVKRTLAENPQNDPNQLTKHHRKCKINGGKSNKQNISHITRRHHEAWHTLTGHKTPQEIAKLFTDIYIDPDYEFICVRKF